MDGLWCFYNFKKQIIKTECYNHINEDTTIVTIVNYDNNQIKNITINKRYKTSIIDTVELTDIDTGEPILFYIPKTIEQQLFSRNMDIIREANESKQQIQKRKKKSYHL